ncbi:MAG: hypothetical protein [Circular genetic element sp.]|nr:MAG: hypothetical protein [Circular genetic element sp.]
MSAKELGMIHNVNFLTRVDEADSTADTLLDLSGQLTDQLQRLVRQGNYFKIAGIDMSCRTVGAATAGTITGALRYYAPTAGRCAAYRAAFKAMAEAMKVKGISMTENRFYDFKVSTRDSSLLTNSLSNCATFDGVSELALNKAAPDGVFQVHNAGVQPVQLSATFNEGFNVFGSAGNDFVLNENQQGFEGMDGEIASEEFERIEFIVSVDEDGTTGGNLQLQWRPDPALYLAVMTGMFEISLESVEVTGATELDLETSIMVAGWKSIMGKRNGR